MTDGRSTREWNNRDVLGFALLGAGCIAGAYGHTLVGNPKALELMGLGIALLFGAGFLSLITSEPVLNIINNVEEGVKNVWN